MLDGFPKNNALLQSTRDSPADVSNSVSPRMDDFGNDFDTNFSGNKNIFKHLHCFACTKLIKKLYIKVLFCCHKHTMNKQKYLSKVN